MTRNVKVMQRCFALLVEHVRSLHVTTMASLLRQASCARPICRAEARTPQQTLHLVASSSSCSLHKTLNLHFAQRSRPRPRLSVAKANASFEAAKGTQGPPGDEASKQFAIAVARVIDEVKCNDIVVLDVAPVVSWTSFLVIGTVFSKPQLLAALARVEKAAAEHFGRARLNLPGSSPWETLDFGDVVVHLFTAEQREYYDIESFYAAAEEVELPFGPNAPAGAGAGQQQSGAAGAQQQQQQQAPTWSTKL
ncbi:hypothetical protein PLESTM_002003300 [Pleodorina starrii]|nr:hypothetical protein PLESTM_002003300 [Pleodorina starrii]